MRARCILSIPAMRTSWRTVTRMSASGRAKPLISSVRGSLWGEILVLLDPFFALRGIVLYTADILIFVGSRLLFLDRRQGRRYFDAHGRFGRPLRARKLFGIYHHRRLGLHFWLGLFRPGRPRRFRAAREVVVARVPAVVA